MVKKKDISYRFHRWKKQLLFFDKLLYIMIIVLLGIFRPDLIVIAVYILLYPYLLLTKRKNASYHLMVSFVIALIWMLVAKGQYQYNIDMITIWGISLFTLFAWATGLFGTYLIYSHWEHILKEKGWLRKLLLFIAFYWPLLIIVETLAYHSFNIRNLASASFPGLPLCNCIHAPLWMQISYFLLGPLFFMICESLGLENPHQIKR